MAEKKKVQVLYWLVDKPVLFQVRKCEKDHKLKNATMTLTCCTPENIFFSFRMRQTTAGILHC